MKLSREVKTGIIVVAGIIAFIFGLSYLKSSPLFENNKTFYAVYDNVGGLQPGTQVSINGYNVGNVTSIKFKDSSGKLLVTISINNEFEFSENSVAELFDTGIIGGKGVQIVPVFDQAPMAKSGDTLKSQIKPGLTELVQQKLTPLQMKVEGAVSHADSLLMNVNQILDDPTKNKLQETIVSLNELVRAFKGSADNLNVLLENNKTQLDSSLKNVSKITSNFSQLSDSLVSADLGGTLSEFQSTVIKLNGILSKIENGEGSLGKLSKDEALYDNLAAASRELDLLLQDFRLNPKRYVNVSVFGKKQKEYTLPENDPAEENNTTEQKENQ
ncbi:MULTISPECIES: MlaD family protein [Flagellimonas]|uniref:Organic solvent ABC transporter substrate-binding protein n=1 Tax=Flagellimonas marinaquae TaxID=254955 RepID=A0AA48HEN6_9FLAO|nr:MULTISPECIES: MlaD family protein [Allomuricauda]MCA0959853.1 MlaD family protein [Allomuricauda ruestringensis]USD24800.1 MlaD family protein [Allomuricauda aquimarina]BDW93790.1 organic solvent ABC transporter substrate-binding protein [Allomuricauda aquimarina]